MELVSIIKICLNETYTKSVYVNIDIMRTIVFYFECSERGRFTAVGSRI
jgi:hypothetical protein